MADLEELLGPEFIKPYSHLIWSLTKNNFFLVDFLTLDPSEIARKCPLPTRDVHKLAKAIIEMMQYDTKKAAGNGNDKKRKRADDDESDTACPKKPKQSVGIPSLKISTLDSRFDKALNGGIQLGTVTEVVGESTTGKSTFVLGLALAVQLPSPRGLGKSAIYVSTEAPLNTTRLDQIRIYREDLDDLLPEDQPSLSQVRYIAAPDLKTQEKIFRRDVPVGIHAHNVGLIIVDSVTANFRAEHGTRTPAQLGSRAADLGDLGDLLRNLAVDHNVAVVVINQVSDRFDNPSFHFRSSSPLTTSSPVVSMRDIPPAVAARRLGIQSLDHQQCFFTGWGDEKGNPKHEHLKTPALGLAWANQIDARIVLKMEQARQKIGEDPKKKRTFAVVFAPWAPATDVPIPYELTTGGMVSVDESTPAKHIILSMTQQEIDETLNDEALWANDDDEEFPC